MLRLVTNVMRQPMKAETVSRYLAIMEDAKIVCKCTRFDMKTRRSLGAQEKYYLADVGIYGARNVDNRIDYGPALENMLYTYLRARGYQVSVGKIGKLECDFITRRANDYAYVQVAFSIAERRVEEREYRPFALIRDSYPRFLFTLDPLLQRRDGVRHLNILDFMSSGAYLEAAQANGPLADNGDKNKDNEKKPPLSEYSNQREENLIRQKLSENALDSANESKDLSSHDEGINETINGTINKPGKLSPDELAVVGCMAMRPDATYEFISHATGFSREKVGRIIQALRDRNVVVRVGARKNGTWKVVSDG